MLTLFCVSSCSKENGDPIPESKEVTFELPSESSEKFEDYDILLTSKTPIAFRSIDYNKQVIEFEESQGGESLSLSIQQIGNNQYSVKTFGDDSYEATIKVSKISNSEALVEIMSNGQEIKKAIVKADYFPGKGLLFTFNNTHAQGENTNGLRVQYESWWDCVQRVALHDDIGIFVGIMSIVYPPTFAVVSVAAGTICLRQSSRIPVK